jgi:uncharacterized protein (TIGR02145 family)
MKNLIAFLSILVLFTNCEKDLTPEFSAVIDDRDNNEYKVVTIGNQTWLAENLRYLPQVHEWNNGSDVQPRYYINAYNGTDVQEAKQQSDYELYGVFYNFPAAENACPDGWRLPGEEDWEELRQHVGKRNDEAYRSKDLWITSLKGNNNSGFNLIPFPGGEFSMAWSTGQPTDVEGRHYAWGCISYNDYRFNHDDCSADEVAYVRCIKE